MIEFRVLGGLDLRNADGAPMAGAFSRPKPLALLVYLALARPRGYHSQDALLALFWPESDVEKGRTSLRQAIHVLRRALGDDVVGRRSRTELGLDASQICCDAVLFEHALAAGRRDEAMALYRGDLLPAYFIPDAPEAERWLDGERARLRALALDALRALIDEAADPDTTVAWTRRAIALAPDDESLVRRGLQWLARAQEFEAALRLYDEYAEQLARSEEGEQPSARLQQQAAAWRAALPPEPVAVEAIAAEVVVAEAVAAEPVAIEPVVAGSVAAPPVVLPVVPDEPALRPDETRSAAPTPATRPRFSRRALAVAALALLAVGGAATYTRRAPAEATPPGDAAPASALDAVPTAARRLVVLPFTVRGGRASDYLRDAMVELLSAKLDGVAGVSAVDPRTLLTFVQANQADSGATPGDIARGQEIARHFGAGQFVLGSVIAAGGRIEATAALYDGDGNRRASADAAGGSEAALFGVADSLARTLLAGIVHGPDAQLARTATATTTSLPALKAFLEGEQHLRGGRREAAAESYQQAVRYDSTFALAWYRLSTSSWVTALVRTSTLQARRYADRLPHAERLLLRANVARDAGAFEDADGLYQAVLASEPGMAEASRQLGELRFHEAPWRGHSLIGARDAFARAVAIDPSDVNAWLHLARIAALEGHAHETDSLATAALAHPMEPGVALELRALRAVATHDRAGQQRAFDALRAAVGRPTPYDDDDAWLVGWRVATYADAPEAGHTIAALLTVPDASPRLQLLGHTAAAHMDAARGRWTAANRELELAARIDPLYAAEVRANLAVIALAALDAQAAAGIVAQARFALGRASSGSRALVDSGPADTTRGASDRVTHDRDALLSVRRPYMLGVLALAAGDSAEVARAERALASEATAAGWGGEMARHFAHQLAARVRWAHGDAAGALRESEAGWPGGEHATGLPLFRGETYTHAAERVLRGDLLRALGRDREALAWYETASEDLGASVGLAAVAHLRRAEVGERLGDRAAAADQYRRAAALWSEGDPAVQDMVRRARERAAALQ